jgi:5-methylcytosine-specific restriction endonuclease McrA
MPKIAVISTVMAIELTFMTDDALVAETKRLAALERRSTAELLSILIEFERRALHLTLGYSSLFAYCTRALLLSEQAAYSRITAARLAKRYPEILQHLAEGTLTLSSVGILAPHLTDDNAAPMLEGARCKSTRDVERLIAALHPQPDIPTSIRALPSTPTGRVPSTRPRLLDTQPADHQPTPATVAQVVSAPATEPRQIVAPIAPRRYLLRVTIGADTHDKLQRVRALLRHAVPDGDFGAIVDRALTLLLREAERTKWASAARPRPARATSSRSRYVPAATKRAVWERDAGQCAFVGPAGRCEATACLEFHHVVPFALGGRTEESNLELRCRAHNQHEALVDVARPY